MKDYVAVIENKYIETDPVRGEERAQELFARGYQIGLTDDQMEELVVRMDCNPGLVSQAIGLVQYNLLTTEELLAMEQSAILDEVHSLFDNMEIAVISAEYDEVIFVELDHREDLRLYAENVGREMQRLIGDDYDIISDPAGVDQDSVLCPDLLGTALYICSEDDEDMKAALYIQPACSADRHPLIHELPKDLKVALRDMHEALEQKRADRAPTPH
ncbi:MAG: hypothetical protein AMS22_11950 [Thiotrichales bacterium SG8_50]|nr:MAG: hypothetical protein AMS22_11950 [Thiotrichales bacterium SG8_50]